MQVEVIMPQPGESIFEGTVTKWLKKVGDFVERDEPLFVISTDKVDMDIPSPARGVLKEILVQEGQTVEVKTVVAYIETEPASGKVEATQEEAPPLERAVNAPEPVMASQPPEPVKRRVFSPLVKKIARENSIELAQLPLGSGISGRVTKHDIMGYIEAHKAAQPSTPEIDMPPLDIAVAEQPAAPKVYVEPKPAIAGNVVPMTPIRRKIADRMVLSQQTSAHVTVVFEVDFSKVQELRNALKDEYEKRYKVHLTYLPFVAQATVTALEKYPIFNASISDGNIVYHDDINLGIAVAVDEGLIVPVIKGANYKNLAGLGKEMQVLSEKARDRKLSLDDVQDGTFTITNNGRFGSLFGTPIILQPQVAIMGLGMVQKRVVVMNHGSADTFGIRPMAYMPLTFDHRLIDGALADQFMSEVKHQLEAGHNVS